MFRELFLLLACRGDLYDTCEVAVDVAGIATAVGSGVLPIPGTELHRGDLYFCN